MKCLLKGMLATSLAALLSCGGPALPEGQGGSAVLTEPHPEQMRAPGWLEFADLSLHSDSETEEPLEPWVKGEILGGRFYPGGPIVGTKERPSVRGAVLISGWLDLRTRAFYPDSDPRPRTAPYVVGLKERSGGFYPLADIVTAPPETAAR